MKGFFITIEGPEGSGKSTLISKLVPLLQAKGHNILVTREPGGIEISEKIRTIIHDPAYTMMDSRTEALLYAAARRQHLVEKVIPALDAGKIVMCDRFIDSSLAYQGYARGLGVDQVLEINRFATEDCMPALTLYVDIEPSEGLARIHKDAGREINRLDLEGLAFHEKVREGYLQLLERFSNRIVRINGAQLPEEVLKDAEKVIEKHLQ
ncbi:dTMP kinase [Ectobacillus panaciterrae]|uniref:dTMP kinase n=1 Tax=Ectobacillus panaciterrae TaxID=363872 RepID=UPI000413C7BE|nr:dTMP kinase [Ectobacillus panaciterrae]